MPSSIVSLVITETEEYYGIGSEAALQFINVFAYAYLLFGYLVWILSDNAILIQFFSFQIFFVDHFAPCLLITAAFNAASGILKWVAADNYE